jgi:hypothetical protein
MHENVRKSFAKYVQLITSAFHDASLASGNQLAQIWLMLPDEQPSLEQLAAWRAMSGERRLQVAEKLYWSARKLKAAGVRQQHPDWPEERVAAEVRRIFLHART